MTAPLHTRPFNIEHARAGAPFCCANGDEVEILRWDRKHTLCIVGLARQDAALRSWRADGTYSDFGSKAFPLVMTPLGFVEGKPFFVGDEIIGAAGGKFAANPHDKNGEHESWHWPAPAKVYPETRMTPNELDDAVPHVIPAGVGLYMISNDDLKAVANAALRHALDAGQVMLPGGELDDETIIKAFGDVGFSSGVSRSVIAAVKSLLVTEPEVDKLKADLAVTSRDLGKAERLLETLAYRNVDGEWTSSPLLQMQRVGRAERPRMEAEQRAARDMAIAEAVRDAIYCTGNPCSTKDDLAAIISKATGQPPAPPRDVLIANAMRKACCEVLEQLNDRHTFKRSDVVAAARLVMNHLDVNTVLAGVKS